MPNDIDSDAVNLVISLPLIGFFTWFVFKGLALYKEITETIVKAYEQIITELKEAHTEQLKTMQEMSKEREKQYFNLVVRVLEKQNGIHKKSKKDT